MAETFYIYSIRTQTSHSTHSQKPTDQWPSIHIIQSNPPPPQKIYFVISELVGGWTNPIEKYQQNWIIPPPLDEKNIFETTTYLDFPGS